MQVPVTGHDRVAELGVVEGERETTDDREAKAFPQPNRSLVRANYKIELHSLKAALPRMLQRMFAHTACHAAPSGIVCCYVTTIRDMCAAASLIGAQVVGANYPAILFRNECLAIRPCPIGNSFGFIHIAWQGVSVAGTDRRLKDLPYRVVIFFSNGLNQHARERPTGVSVSWKTVCLLVSPCHMVGYVVGAPFEIQADSSD
jgi:hypothetical protein